MGRIQELPIVCLLDSSIALAARLRRPAHERKHHERGAI
jgi:hypothetical protein